MIALQSTDSLRIVCADATTLPLPIWATWADDGASPRLGRSSAQTNGTSTVIVVSSPETDHVRVVRTITIANPNTAAVTVTVSAYDGAVLRTLGVHSIAAGQTLVYADGWKAAPLSSAGLPDYSTALERSVLTLINGVPTWKTGLAGPAGDGDIFLWLENMVAANKAAGVPSFSVQGITTGIMFRGLGMLQDGNVVCVNQTSGSARKFLPATNTLTSISSNVICSSAFITPCTLPDGRVVIPFNSSLKIYDPVADTVFTSAADTTGIYTVGCMALPNDRILCLKGSGVITSLSIYDIATNTFAYVTGLTSSTYQGATMLRDGRVVLRSSSTYYAVYNPTDDTIQMYVSSDTGRHAVTLADGRVLMTPSGTAYMRILDPDTMTLSQAGTTTIVGNTYHMPTLLPDGRVLLLPRAQAPLKIFNPSDNSIATTPLSYGASAAPATTSPVVLSDGSVLVCGNLDQLWRIYPVPDWSFKPGVGMSTNMNLSSSHCYF